VQCARHADQKALGKWGLGCMAKERPHVVFGFSAAWRKRAAVAAKNLPHVDLVVGPRNFIALPLCGNWLRERRRAGHDHPLPAIAEWMIRASRLWMLPRRQDRNPRFATNKSRLAGNCVRFNHAGMQHALHVLHRPQTVVRSRSIDEIVREVGSGCVWSEGNHAAWANREFVRPPRIS
jgi:hypothetical protein